MERKCSPAAKREKEAVVARRRDFFIIKKKYLFLILKKFRTYFHIWKERVPAVFQGNGLGCFPGRRPATPRTIPWKTAWATRPNVPTNFLIISWWATYWQPPNVPLASLKNRFFRTLNPKQFCLPRVNYLTGPKHWTLQPMYWTLNPKHWTLPRTSPCPLIN